MTIIFYVKDTSITQSKFVYKNENNLGEITLFIYRNIRTNQIGTTGRRNPKLIDNKSLYKRVVGGMIGKLLTKGPDLEPTKRRPSRPNGGYQSPNSGYGSPPQSPNSGYGRPTQQTPNTGYGRPVQQTPNTGYGRPSQQTPNTGYGRPSVPQGPTTSYNRPSAPQGPSTSYNRPSAPRPSSGYGRPSSNQRPNRPRGQNKPRPPRKIPPMQMPMIENPKGHFSPPAPGGVIFQFQPKKAEGGFLPAAPYFKNLENSLKPNQLAQNNAFAYRPGTPNSNTGGSINNNPFILTPSVSSTAPNPPPPNQFNPFNTINTTPKPEAVNKFTPFRQQGNRPQLLISTTPTPSIWNNNQVQATNIAPPSNQFQMANSNSVASNIAPTNQFQLNTNIPVSNYPTNNQQSKNPLNLNNPFSRPVQATFPEVPKNRPNPSNSLFQTQESQISNPTPPPKTSVTFKPSVQKGHSLINDVKVNDNNKNLLNWYRTLYESYPELLDDNPQDLNIQALAQLTLNQNITDLNRLLQQKLFNQQRQKRYQLLIKQQGSNPIRFNNQPSQPVHNFGYHQTQTIRPVLQSQQNNYSPSYVGTTNTVSTTPYNLPINSHVVSSSLSFGGRPSSTSENPNVVYGKTLLPPAQSRSDPSAQSTFPNFILNPRAASSIYTNRAPRTIPKDGIPTRFINNVPIRQWQWPDYS